MPNNELLTTSNVQADDVDAEAVFAAAADWATASPGSDRCCWNRFVQACHSDDDCDRGGEGCVVDGTKTQEHGNATCGGELTGRAGSVNGTATARLAANASKSNAMVAQAVNREAPPVLLKSLLC